MHTHVLDSGGAWAGWLVGGCGAAVALGGWWLVGCLMPSVALWYALFWRTREEAIPAVTAVACVATAAPALCGTGRAQACHSCMQQRLGAFSSTKEGGFQVPLS